MVVFISQNLGIAKVYLVNIIIIDYQDTNVALSDAY